MLSLELARTGRPLKLLCLGAHSDDIEIGAAGTVLGWIASGVALDVHWCVLSAVGTRREEALAGAEAVLAGVSRLGALSLLGFPDGYFPTSQRPSRCGSRT